MVQEDTLHIPHDLPIGVNAPKNVTRRPPGYLYLYWYVTRNMSIGYIQQAGVHKHSKQA